MDIIVSGYWRDDSGTFDGYLCRIGEPLEGTEDEKYFFYFDSEEDILGLHTDFVITDWSGA